MLVPGAVLGPTDTMLNKIRFLISRVSHRGRRQMYRQIISKPVSSATVGSGQGIIGGSTVEHFRPHGARVWVVGRLVREVSSEGLLLE